MESAVAEVEAMLQTMVTMKPPGVSGSKISAICQICNANIQSESVLIQKLYTHFKKTPGTHKLGVIYVVDSVTRQWLDHARKAKQTVSPDAAGGTYAAGVFHVTELLPSFMNDTLNYAPEDQKARILKLVEIWERGSTFPASMLATFKEKLSAQAVIASSTQNVAASTTPDGTPPKNSTSLSMNNGHANAAAPAAAQPANTAEILERLKGMARNQQAGVPNANQSNTVMYSHSGAPNLPPVNPSAATAMPMPGQAVNVPGVGGMGFPNVNFPPPTYGQGMPNGQMTLPIIQRQPMQPQQAPPAADLQQSLNYIQALQARGIPQEQWASLLTVLMQANAGGNPSTGTGTPVSGYGGFAGAQEAPYPPRDRNGFDSSMRSPEVRARNGRDRSRSPKGWDRRREASPPRRRESPVYGEYGNDRGRGDGRRGTRGGGQNPYRQRSPDRSRRSPSPRRDFGPPQPRWMEHDHTMGPGIIKVFSRTLFVGGVTCGEEELRSIFVRFGRVQTCIVNVDKRHAFVKMITRDEAMRAKEGMDNYRSPEMQLRTRWGVGFGPRDCSDYQTGISKIPIERLTDADKKWMLTAEYGGTGGEPITSGLVVEEPDIEIGAGVSSKAISRRMQTDKGGQQGPRSTRDPPFGNSNGSRYRQPEGKPINSEQNHSAAPAGSPFGFQQMANMPNVPNMPPTPANFAAILSGIFGAAPPGQGNGQPLPPGA